MSQTHLISGSDINMVATGDVQLVLDGDFRNDGTMWAFDNATWNFKGNTQQKIACLTGACASIGTSFCSDAIPNSFMNIYQDNPAGIRFEMNAIIKGTHTFNQGICQINDCNVKLYTNASFSGVSNTKFYATTGQGYLLQKVNGTAFFPIGSTVSSNNYAPAKLTNSVTDDYYFVGMRVYDSVYNAYNSSTGQPIGSPMNNHRVAKTWIVNSCGLPAANTVARLYWKTAHEYFDFGRTYCEVIYYDYGTAFWDRVMGFSAALPSDITGADFYHERVLANTVNYSQLPLTVEDINTFLPLRSIELAVEKNGKDALLTWKTYNELAMQYYEAEFSVDGINFSRINQQASKGNGDFTYIFLHNNVDAWASRDISKIYYRIRAVDRNNAVSYSDVKTISLPPAGQYVKLYPVPADKFLVIKSSGLRNGKAEIKLVNNTGQIVYRQDMKVQNNQLQQTVDVSSLRPGTYHVIILSEEKPYSEKIVVIH